MENGNMIILAIIMNTFHKIDSVLNGIPRDTEIRVNDSTYLNCSTSLLAHRIQWRHGKNYVYTEIAILEPYNDGRFSVEINASTGACDLVIRSVQPSDAGTYECTEDEGFGEQKTAQLIVLDVFSSEVTVNVAMNDEVRCIANTSQSCSYKWKWFNGDDVTTESANQNLNPRKGGMHRCEAKCSIRNKSCSVQSMHATVHSEEDEDKRRLDEIEQQRREEEERKRREEEERKRREEEERKRREEEERKRREEEERKRREEEERKRREEEERQKLLATSGQNLMPLLALALLLVPALAAIGVIMYSWRKRTKKRRLDEIEQQRREKESLLEVERRRQDEIERQKREEEKRKRREEEERLRPIGCQNGCHPVATSVGYNCNCDVNQTILIASTYGQCPVGCSNTSSYCACNLPVATPPSSTPTTTASLDEYNMYCGQSTFSDPIGNITSPYYPSNYQNNQFCNYVIVASSLSTIKFIFNVLGLERESACSFDWIEFTCVSNSVSRRIRYCGSGDRAELIFKPCTRVLMAFRADGVGIGMGFSVSYNIEPIEGIGAITRMPR